MTLAANHSTMKFLCMLILAVLCCLTARAEDWTVNGKNYHNVQVGQVEPDRVHITYDGGIGTVMLADLPPDLQKRFNYDPSKAKAAAQQRDADQQAAIQSFAAADQERAKLQAEQVKAETASAEDEEMIKGGAELKKHPLTMKGRVTGGSNGEYLINADQYEIAQPVRNALGDYEGSYPLHLANANMVLNGAGGSCFLVTEKTYTVNQEISLTVYSAGTQIDNGDQYARYSDDPATAYKLSKATK